MSFIETAAEAEPSAPNYEKAFSLRPGVYDAWLQFNSAIKDNMDLRRYELVTLAAARRLRSSYCSLAHGSVLLEKFLEPDALQAVMADHRSAGLDEVDVAVMDLADKVAGDATSVTRVDIERLRSLGLSDAEIFDIVAAAAMRCFFSKTLDGLGAEPDARFAELDPEIRSVLAVGRPMADR